MKRMKSIPGNCLWIVKAIRRGVPRPKPSDYVWSKGRRRYRTWQSEDPMGMHPRANHSLPLDCTGFPLRKPNDSNDEDVKDFGVWWDSVPKGAVRSAIRAVWGRTS